MFERLKKAMADLTNGKEYKSIFDLEGVPAYSQFYDLGILPWKMVYRGFYKPWHIIPAPTIANPNQKRNLAYLSLGKAVCAEIAGLVWTDQCDVCVSMNNGPEEDPLNAFVADVLKKNNFSRKMREAIEQAAALGGEALKVWWEPRFDEEGRVIDGCIRVGYVMADQFVPTAWNNAEVTEGIFVTRQAKDGFYYTKLEWHKWNGTTYVITNDLFRTAIRRNGDEAQDILGYRYPLAAIYPYLDGETRISVDHSLFAYFRTPEANNLDDNSPLGISVYANVMETLHAIDICFDSFVREFRLGKKRIIVPARAIQTVVDPATGNRLRYFDATDETYEALATDDIESLKVHDNSVELRVEEHVSALNAFLNILCLQVGLSAGTFSFDRSAGLKTATEVISENSKTYKTVKNFQNQITPAIERLVESIIEVASLYEVEWDGKPVRELAAGGYEVKVSMDDGILQDRQTNINEGISLCGAGLMSKYTFLTDPKYGQNLTDEEAKLELKRIADESKVDVGLLDVMGENDAI